MFRIAAAQPARLLVFGGGRGKVPVPRVCLQTQLDSANARLPLFHPKKLLTLFSTYNYKENPFRILGIPIDSSLDEAKQAFLKLAMKKHPDRGGSAKEFIRIRSAFSRIMSSDDNKDIHEDTGSSNSKYPEWQVWFHQNTGMDLSFEMSDATREEVVRVYRTLAQGGKDKGGYWDMARQLAEQEEEFDRTGRKPPPLQLSPVPQSVNEGMRRRRRR